MIMEKENKKEKRQKKIWERYPEMLIALAVFLVIGFVSRIGWLDVIELQAYDLLLKVKPDTEERSDIVIAAIDDASIAVEGTFPWPRDVLADAIIRMRELGAEQVTFDIEYLSPSTKGINPAGQKNLPETFLRAEQEVSEILTELASAISIGQMPVEYVIDTTNDIVTYNIIPTFDLLQQEINQEVFRDNDAYFAQALRMFGNSWLTINAGDVGIAVPETLENYVRENNLLDDVTEPTGLIESENKVFFDEANQEKKMTPTLELLMRAANGAGFTNIILDTDGTRRRVELLHETEGQYIAQLVFAPLLDTLDSTTLVRKRNSLIVKDALFPGEEERRDVTIPLDANGRILINWIPDTFRESFKNESLLFLHNLDEMEESLLEFLKSIGSFQLGTADGFLTYYYAADYLLASYEDLELTKKLLLEEAALVDSRDDARYDEYFARRQAFFEECSELTNSFYLDEIITVLQSIITDENRSDIESAQAFVVEKFEGFTKQLEEYNSLYTQLKDSYNGAFVVVGHTASNSTDLGTTPFEGQYPNVGTHANVYNTIMNESFITPVSRNITAILSFFLLFLYAYTARRVGSTARNICGAITIIIVPLVGIGFMYFDYYIALASTLFNVIFAYVGILLWQFFSSEKDKKLLRQSFETYLSDDVVEEIVQSGVKPELGGEERHVTALFSDIKAFSSFSEQLSATQLVEILNDYLTALSDEILINRGTIDKYIGDAIVAIFGAPVPMEDHAWRACVSAIKMKQAEELVNASLKETNEKLVAEGKKPVEIKTRIGLNTGDIVVGNMGTQKKMNYTMMGDDVNLAARLEGVNKSYSSWILVSQTTWDEANSGENEGKLLGRRLDRVRVVGRSTPVQLYNLVGIMDELPQAQIECVNMFHKGLDLYLDKKFKEARDIFQKALKIYPSDGPSAAFSVRCEEFIKKGVPAKWDGVLNMTSK